MPLPPLSLQRKVAEILSAYDELIENNTRRIKIVEEMARSLYRVRFVDTCQAGTMPKNWRMKSINDFISIKSGFAFKSSTFTLDGFYGLVTIKNVHDGFFHENVQSRISNLPPNMPEFCHLRTGDILLSLTGNIGRTCLVQGQNYLLNQRVAKLVPLQSQDRAYTYLTFRQPEFQEKLKMISNGVAQQNLSPIETGRLEHALPGRGELDEFAELAEPFVKQILYLFLKNASLRRARDLLLPKLISGDVSLRLA